MTSHHNNIIRVGDNLKTNDDGKVEIHVSDVRAYNSCRFAYYLTSNSQLGLEPQEPNKHFFYGHLVHDTFEIYYSPEYPDVTTIMEAFRMSAEANLEKVRANNPLRKSRFFAGNQASMAKAIPSNSPLLQNKKMDMWDEIVHEVKQVMYNYALWIDVSTDNNYLWNDDKFEFIDMEQSWSLDMEDEPFFFAGRFDGVVKNKSTGKYYLFETKTSSNPKGLIRSLPVDDQATLYMYAAQELYGRQFDGVIYNIIYKQIPRVPKELKSGLLSKDKGMNTSYEFYLDCLMNHHDNWPERMIYAEYGEYLQYLKQQRANNFVIRHIERRSQKELELFIERFKSKSREISNPDTIIVEEPNQITCGQCKFFKPCLARRRGQSDWFNVVRSMTQPREVWSSAISSEPEHSHSLAG